MTFRIPGVWASIDTPPRAEASEAHQEVPADVRAFAAGCALGAVDGIASDDGDDLALAISGNHYWRDREISDREMRSGVQAALRFAYRRHGERLLDKLAGRFSLVVWDPGQRRGFAATDRFGIMPVYWAQHAGRVAIAPTADQALQVAGLHGEIEPQSIYHYLFFHMVPSPGTVYRGLHKLPAAHALRFGEGGIESYCYWLPHFSETRQSQRHNGNEMLQLLQGAVAQFDGGEGTGAFLSGGLDSSTVSGLLAQHRPAPATFSIGFDADGYDEIGFARIASSRFGTRPHEYYVTPEDVLDALPKVAAAYDEPFGNSSAIPAYFCAQHAREYGIGRLLAGDGGDELFAGNARYAKQTVFEIYQLLPGPLRQRLIEPMAGLLPEKGPTGKLRSYINQARVPLPERLHTYNFLMRFAPKQLLSEAFLDGIDTDLPLALESRIYQRPSHASRLNRMLYLDWQHTLADNDLRKVNRMCQLAGIEVEYPMLDDQVVDFSLRIPSHQKMRFNRLRDYYKRSVTGFLPEQIINKSKHGFGLPFGVWMSNHAGLQALADGSLESFRDRDIVNSAFIDELLTLHGKSHAGYYGELVWVLVMLELWLNAHGL